MSEKSNRRGFMRGLVAAGAAAGMVVGMPAARAQIASSINIINVGKEKDFKTVQAALASITDAAAENPYLILVDAGVYVIADGGGPITLKPYVSVSGVDRQSVVFVGEGSNNIKCSSYSSLSNFMINHTGLVEAIRSDVKLTDFHINHLYINMNSSKAAIATYAWVYRMEIRNTTIVTQGIGINMIAGGFLYIHDTNIHLFGASHSPHIGIRAKGGECRIFVFGGKIGTGYGYGEVEDPNYDVIGVLADTNVTGRIVLHGIWSICRNNSVISGANVNCVRINGANGWVRIFGSYLQAEASTDSELVRAVTNPGNGRIEFFGSRIRDYGIGNIHSPNQIGLQNYSVVDNGKTMVNSSGGMILLDASSGSFTLYLPLIPLITEQYIFKKIDNSSNIITIYGNGHSIDGFPSQELQVKNDKLNLRYGGNNRFYIVG